VKRSLIELDRLLSLNVSGAKNQPGHENRRKDQRCHDGAAGTQDHAHLMLEE
jgi:hypothetical protein